MSIKSAPVILTGRGGSGTRLLAEIAIHSGLFLGNRLNKSSDSVEWVDHIYKMALEKLSANEADDTYHRWSGPLQTLSNEILSSGDWREGQPWGWKLPESMLVLPELLQIFPEAKIIHLVRHPVDSSLRRTHMTSRMDNPIGQSVLKAAYKAAQRELQLIAQDDDYLHNALTWDYQVSRVTELIKTSNLKDRYLELRYEDICTDALSVSNRVRSFVGLPEKQVVMPEIDMTRTKHYTLPDPRIDEVWKLCKSTAVGIGYEPVSGC